MKLTQPHKLHEIAAIIQADFAGDPEHIVTGFNEIHRVEAGDVTFVDVAKYFNKALNSAATTIIINEKVPAPPGKALIFSTDPFRDYNYLTEHFQPRLPFTLVGNGTAQNNKNNTCRIGRNVVFGENVQLGENVEIGHNVVIGSNVTIGDETIIYPNVTVYDNTQIGRFVTIQSGAVIGSEAFYFKKRAYGREKMLTKGAVVIDDYVDIGANTTIDRGVSAITHIGEYTKIDNLVQIGHDTIIGKRCVIAAQVGIAGVTTIEDDVILWGQVGITSDVVIGKSAVLLAKTGVISSLEGNKTYFGMVAKEWKKKWREYVSLEKLPALMDKLEKMSAEQNTKS